jgi:hypothetical protein
MFFKSYELFSEIPKEHEKTLDLRPFEDFSVFLAFFYIFGICQKLLMKTNGVLLLFNVVIFTFQGEF